MSEVDESIESKEMSSRTSGTGASASATSRSVTILDSLSKISKMTTFNFMEKRNAYQVIEDSIDYTPDNLVDPTYVTMDDVFTHAAFESRPRKTEPGLKASSISKVEDESGMKVYATTINLDDIYIDHTLNTEKGIALPDIDLETAPSAFYLPLQKPLMSYPPEVLIVLKETEFRFLFDLPTFCYDKGTAEAAAVEEENELYNYMTVGKGRNRKTVMEETQTKSKVTQTRHTLAPRPQKKNAICFASLWDMHDTYDELARIKPDEEADEMVLYQAAAPWLLRKPKKKQVHCSRRGKTFEEIAEKNEFYDAVLLVERVIASKQYSDAQKKFRGLMPMDPLSLDLVYIYTMKPLWTFECDETINRPIISISFNSTNPNILAVAHGRFGLAENQQGFVCIWCTKNPCKPERIYKFKDPLTSVAFSKKNPNSLACGFANGDVLILDITSYFTNCIAKSKRDTNPCFEPIWVVSWRAIDKENEYVMTACQDGRINRFTSTKTHDFICSPMMRLSSVEGKTKGPEFAKTCHKADVAITRYPAALCMKWHPIVDHVYYVGTDEGCIHKCSKHYLNQHMDVFKAHAGPVYDMDFSPFMNKLLVSCGADNAIRLWLEGMDDVIMTLNCSAAVYGIAFCPINSTIILSVSANILSVWDLRRKVHIPCAEYNFPTNVKLTYIKFSDSGDNVFVGDSSGRIYTFHLEDTPIAPFYQREMLNEAIKKVLCTRPQLLKQMDKLENQR